MIGLLVNERILRDFFSPGEPVLLSSASQGGHPPPTARERGREWTVVQTLFHLKRRREKKIAVPSGMQNMFVHVGSMLHILLNMVLIFDAAIVNY